MSKNILIVGGGTGGHINPGIALYEKFKEEDILNQVLLLCMLRACLLQLTSLHFYPLFQ